MFDHFTCVKNLNSECSLASSRGQRDAVVTKEKVVTRGMCVSHSVVSDCLQLYGLQPTRLLCPWGFSRKEYWNGLPSPSPILFLNLQNNLKKHLTSTNGLILNMTLNAIFRKYLKSKIYKFGDLC